MKILIAIALVLVEVIFYFSGATSIIVSSVAIADKMISWKSILLLIFGIIAFIGTFSSSLIIIQHKKQNNNNRIIKNKPF